MKRAIYFILGFVFLFTGASYLLNSITGITGFVIIEESNRPFNSLLGTGLICIGLFLLKKTRKKGQAAIELTMTYGWMIIAVIVTIAILIAVGAFNPDNYTNGAVFLSPPFYANAWNVQQNKIILEIKNNGDERYNIENISISNCGINSSSLDVEPKNTTVITIDCNPLLNKEESFKGEITIKYKKGNSQITLTSTGTIVEKVI